MSRRGNPQVYGQEEAMLKQLNPEYENPEDVEAEQENAIRQKIARKENMIEGMQDELYGITAGKGYLRPPNAMGRGYLAPPQATGGWIFPLAMLASSIIPSLFGKGASGKGIRRQPLMLTSAPNLTSASAFYRDIARQATGQGMSHKTFVRLFGDNKTYKDMIQGKIGSGVHDKLLMGHLLAPLVHGHLKKALKGTGLSAEQVMAAVEDKLPEIFDKEVTPEVMARGGSILGSLWGGLKNVFGKIGSVVKGIFSNPKVREIGKNVINKVGDVAEKRAPDLAEMAANRIADYASKKLKGDEPAAEMEDDEGDDDDEYYEERKKKRPVKKSFEPSATRKFEQPSASRDSSMRKKIIAERKSKALVPREEETSAPKEKVIVGYTRQGMPIYGNGLFDWQTRLINKMSNKSRYQPTKFAQSIHSMIARKEAARRDADYQNFKERMKKEQEQQPSAPAGVGWKKKRSTVGGAWSVKLVRE